MANYRLGKLDILKNRRQEHISKKLPTAKTTFKGVASEIVNELSNFGGKVTKGVEKIVIGEKEGLSAKFLRVEHIIPEIITSNDESIYATITVRNNGTCPFPSNCYL